jgi:hypothetical protein
VGYNLAVDAAYINGLVDEMTKRDDFERLSKSKPAHFGIAIKKGMETPFLSSFTKLISATKLSGFVSVVRTYRTTIIFKDRNSHKDSSFLDGYMFVKCLAAELLWPIVELVLDQAPHFYRVIGMVDRKDILKYETDEKDLIETSTDSLTLEKLKKKYRELVEIIKNKKVYFQLPARYLKKAVALLDMSPRDLSRENVVRALLLTG